ncbi:MAG: hypothetical protein HXX20_24940 [Chloroflexi bacterium]|nr:hypothetical protein [Chloroflexota bacterium]
MTNEEEAIIKEQAASRSAGLGTKPAAAKPKKEKKLETRICADCGNKFQGTRATWFCSPACKTKSYRKRKEEEVIRDENQDNVER